MSEMTECNRCSLQEYRKEARDKGMKVTTVRNAKWGMGGVNVYRHPPEVKVADIEEDSPEHKKYSIAWFMSIPAGCEC